MTLSRAAAVWAGILLLLFAACRHTGGIVDDGRIVMVPIEGGTFMMGDVVEKTHPDALPLHEVRIRPFKMSKYETTFEQYDAFALATGRELPSDDGHGRGRRAVTYVSWNDADAFCRYHGYRLPTEAEWEYAARDAGAARVYAGTDVHDSLSAYAFINANSRGFSMPVGLKKPTPLGLHDMSGNAAEWVGAYYERYPKTINEAVFKDLERSGFRITRGGSFAASGEPPQPALTTRTYWRAGTLDEVRSFAIGFRCVD